MTYIIENRALHCFAILVAVLLAITSEGLGQGQDGLANPPIVKPYPTTTRTHEGTLTISDLTAAADAVVVLPSNPTPSDYNFRTVRKVRAYVVFHAGGSRETYEFGKAAWSATVTGRLVGVVLGSPNVEYSIQTGITLSIDQSKPEAVYVLPSNNSQFQPSNHPFYNGGTSTKYDQVWFVIDAPADFSRTNTAIDAHLRLSMRVDEEVVYEFPTTYATLRCSVASSSVLSGSCAVPMSGAADYRARKVAGTDVVFNWKSPLSVSGSQIDEYEIEVLRLYNTSASYREYATAPWLSTTIDWSAARRFVVKAVPGPVSFKVIPSDGSGYYTFRVRPISSRDVGGANAPRNLGLWSDAPADGATLIIDPCVCPFSTYYSTSGNESHVAVFYFDDAQATRTHATKQIVLSDTARGSYIGESRTYLDAFGRVVQSVERDRDLLTALVSGIVYDRDGRPSLQSVPAPRMTIGNTYDDGMGYSGTLLRYGVALYSNDHYDDVSSTYFTPGVVSSTSPGSRYYSSDNPTKNIASAEGYPYSRTLYGSDGRPFTSILPGKDQRPTSGDQKSRSSRTILGNVSQEDLNAVFGPESPNARNVSKVISITPDGVAFGEYRDNANQLLATFAIANQSQVPGNIGTIAQIAADGDGTLAMANGDIGTHTAAEETRENVLIAQSSVEMPAEFVSKGDTLVTTTKVALSTRSSLTVVVTYTPQAVETITYGSQTCTTEFQLNCNQSMFVRVFRVDTIPHLEIVASTPTMPKPFTSTAVVSAPYVFADLPPGEYIIERRIISGGRDASGRTPVEKILATSLPASTVSSTLQSILNDCFGSSLAPPSTQLAYYKNFRTAELDPKVLKWKISTNPEQILASPCYEIPLPIARDCDACPEGSALPFENLQYAQYAMNAFASKFPGAPREEIFFTVDNDGTRHAKVNGTTASIQQRVNKIFEGLLSSEDEDCQYKCKELWLLWTGLVDSRIETLDPQVSPNASIPANPKVLPGQGDIIEALLQTVGLCIDDVVTKPNAMSDGDGNYSVDSDAEALEMYKKVRLGYRTPQQRDECIAQFTTVVGGVTYIDWNSVNGCLRNQLTQSQEVEFGKASKTGLPKSPTGGWPKLHEELVLEDLDKCRASCEELDPVITRQLTIENPAASGGEIYCKARAVIDDCRASCVVSNPPTSAEILKRKQMMYGRLQVATPVASTCQEGYQLLYNPNINSTLLINALIDYLNDHYDQMRKTVRVNTCVNYARVIYDFLNNFIPGQIPECIVQASQLGPEIGIEADCRSFENNPNVKKFYLRVLPGVPGTFRRPSAIDNCEICAIDFTGPKFAASTQNPPTLDPTEHEWVSLLNLMADDLWGIPVGSRQRSLSTEHLKAPPADRWYEFAEKGVQFDSLGVSNIDSAINAVATQLRTDLHNSSSGVNGLIDPLLYFNHGASGFSYAAPAWAAPLWTPFGTVFAFDNASWRTHDTTDAENLTWRSFGTIGIQFDDRRATFNPSANLVSYFSWTLLPGPASDTSIGSLKLVSNVLGEPFVDTWTSTESGLEYREIADSLFTNKIGRFYMTDQWKLGYHDYIRDRKTVVDAVWFYQTHTRRLIANQGPAACVWDSLCLKQIGCAVCVKWDTLSSTHFDQIDRTGPMPCDGVEVERLKAEISRLYYESLDKFKQFVELQAATKCGANTNCSKIVAKTTERTYHYTLYYYDRAGRLVRTVSPKGVKFSPSHTRTSADPSHTFVSAFTVDSKGRVLTKTVPDGGTEEYYYDRYGRLRFSVNAVQSGATPNRMTYYKYDRLSRIEETGEAVLGSSETIASVVSAKLDNTTATDPVSNPWPEASDNRVRNDVAKYFYDERASLTTYFTDALSRWAAVTSKLTGTTQRNVRGRLSWALAVPTLASGAHITTATTDVVRSYFSYDAHGNTISSISSVPYSPASTIDADFLITRTDYEYDLSTGSVVRVDFQPTVPAERFIHRYTYDGSGRLKYVETSRNDVLYDRDAAYDYNRNGSLRRETIGEDSVQGRDYTYTLLGQLKGINHPTLDPTKDPGLDGSSGDNANVAKDAFGMAFHYHTDDFIHNTGTTPSVFADGQAGMLGVATPLNNPAYDLYGGQIGAWTMKTQAIPAGTLNGATLLRNGTLVGDRFRYDVLGRLREDTTYSHNGTNWVSDGAGGWSAGFRYDQNSNMRKVKRWAMTTANTSILMDDATFMHHSVASNSVKSIGDLGSSASSSNLEEIRDMPAVSTNAIDNSGSMLSVPFDVMESNNVFNSTKKVRSAVRGSTEIGILRNANDWIVRIDANTPESETPETSYFIIASGPESDRAVYSRSGSTGIPALYEWGISSIHRIGVRRAETDANAVTDSPFHRVVGSSVYELRDHLGSVRCLVEDINTVSGSGHSVELIQSVDYDPFGFKRWNVSFELDRQHRYSWQGMRRIDGKNDAPEYLTPFRMYDVRSGRWSSHDPQFASRQSPYTFGDQNPISVTDTWGLDGTVTVNGREVHVYVPIRLYGVNESSADAEKYERAIEKEWNNGGKGWSFTFGRGGKEEYHVTIDVSVEFVSPTNEALSNDQTSAHERSVELKKHQPGVNEVLIVDEPRWLTPEDNGRSYVTNGNVGVWSGDLNDYSHEFGHFLGLGDRYFVPRRWNTENIPFPFTTWEGNIMGTEGRVQMKNINEFMYSYVLPNIPNINNVQGFGGPSGVINNDFSIHLLPNVQRTFRFYRNPNLPYDGPGDAVNDLLPQTSSGITSQDPITYPPSK